MENTPLPSSASEPYPDNGITSDEAAALYAPLDTDVGPTRTDSAALTTMEGWYALATGFLYLMFVRATTWLPFHVSVVVLMTLVSLVLMLVFTVRVARSIISRRALIINFTLSSLLILPKLLIPILATRFPTWSGWPFIGGQYMRYQGLLKHVEGLDGLILMWFAACIGVGVSRLIREMKMLLPISVVLASVDMYVVFGGGLVTQATQGHSPIAAAAMWALTVKLPTMHVTRGAAPLQLAIGMADFLFIALFFACFKKFGVAAWNTFIVMCAVLSVYMLIVAYKDLPLPALVPIAVVVVGMNLRQFRYERSEGFALLYAGIIVTVVGGIFWFLSRK